MNNINKIVLRLLKDNKSEWIKFIESNNPIYKNVIYNNIFVQSISDCLLVLKLIETEKKLKKIIENKDNSIKHIIKRNRIIIYDFKDENYRKICKYFDANGIVWNSYQKFSDLSESIYFNNDKYYCNTNFYIMLFNGRALYGVQECKDLVHSYKDDIIYKADEFIKEFEKIKKEYNKKVAKIL